MDFGIVFTSNTQHVNDLTDGGVGVLGPIYNLDHHLVASLAAGKFVQRNKDVGSQELAVGSELGKVLEHLQRADKYLFLALENLNDFGLGLQTVACRTDVYQHAVAVQGVHRLALGNHDGLAVVAGGIHAVLTVAAANKDAFSHRRTVRRLVAAGTHLHQESIHGELVQYLNDEHAALGRIGTHSSRHLLVVER